MNNGFVARWSPTGVSGIVLMFVIIMGNSMNGRIDDLHTEVRSLRAEMSELNTRVGRIEGILEVTTRNRFEDASAALPGAFPD